MNEIMVRGGRRMDVLGWQSAFTTVVLWRHLSTGSAERGWWLQSRGFRPTVLLNVPPLVAEITSSRLSAGHFRVK